LTGIERAIGRILTVFLALFACFPAHAQDPGDRQSAPYSEYVRHSFYVEVRDGTRLAMNTYRPAVDGRAIFEPMPVVFAFTPYRARYRDDDGTVVEVGRSERLGLKGLTDYGYVVAVADIRGKGASFGRRRGFQDRTEARDGYDLIEWLARQPWSNGRIGMTGCSYLGGTTVQTATTAPPSLKAVFAGASDFDKYTFVRRGGITAQFNTRPDEPLEYDLQSIPVDDDPSGKLLSEAVAQHAGNTPMAGLWYGMPFRDSESSFTGNRFWDEVGPFTYLEQLRKSDIAFYFWGNWSDEPTEQIIKAAANVPSRLLIGPGSHCRPSPEIDFAAELRRFFDFHLKGIDNGLDREPPYKWRLQNVDEKVGWIRSDKLPGADMHRTPLYIAWHTAMPPDGKSGLLSSKVPEDSGAVAFRVRYDLDQDYFSFWPDPLDEYGATFTASPLESDVALVGFPIVDLKIAVDRSDANVFAYIEDVSPTGEVVVVSFGRLAASHRQLSEAPYDNLGLPFQSGKAVDAQAMIPGQPSRLKFALLPNAWVFKAGHRIRLTITGADPRQRNLSSIAENPPPRITVLYGGENASRAEIPLAHPGQLTGSPFVRHAAHGMSGNRRAMRVPRN
jgi:predicted acyl esterase